MCSIYYRWINEIKVQEYTNVSVSEKIIKDQRSIFTTKTISIKSLESLIALL